MHSFLSYSLVLLAPLTLILHLSLYLTSISLPVVSFITHCLSPSSLSFPLILTLYTKEISVEAKWYEDFCLICLPWHWAPPLHLIFSPPVLSFSSHDDFFSVLWLVYSSLSHYLLAPSSSTPVRFLCHPIIISELPFSLLLLSATSSPPALCTLFVTFFLKSSTLQLSAFPPVTISWICAAPWVWI